jgi:hypothetical protein
MARWVYRDKAGSVAAAPRLIGGNSLTLRSGDGTKFGDEITPESPMRITIYRGTTLMGVLKAIGRDGDTLLIDGAADDYADFTVAANDKCGNVQVAGDFGSLWDAIETKADAADVPDLADYYDKDEVDGLIADKADASTVTAIEGRLSTAETNLAGKEDRLPDGGMPGQYLAHDRTWKPVPDPDLTDFPTRTEVDNGLATKASTTALGILDGRVTAAEGDITSLQTGKENSLPTGGSAGQYLAHDRTWGTPPKGLVHIGRWSTSTTAAASTGEMDSRLVASPVDAAPAQVLISATANTTGASVQITVGGSNLFASAVTLAGGTTNPIILSSFALPTIPAGSPVKPSITAIGGDVRGLVVDVWAREV